MNSGVPRRIHRSLLTGVIAGAAGMLLSVLRGNLAAKAAAAHESVTKLLMHGFIAVGAIAAVLVFVIGSMIAASRSASQGSRSARPQRRMRREDW